MRVVHLVTSLNTGGIQRWLLQLLEETPRSKCEMDVICQGFSRGEWSARARESGAKVFLNPFTPDHILFALRLAKIIRNYDIVHIHVGAYSGFPTWLAHKLGLRVVTTFHNVRFPAQHRLFQVPIMESLRTSYATKSINYAVKNSDFLVGVSSSALNAFVPDSMEMRAKSRVIPHGVEIPKKGSDNLRAMFREKLGWSKDSKLIVNVGRFHPQKNHRSVLKVFELVMGKLPAARLVLIGDGPLFSDIRQMAKAMLPEDSVAFLGFRDDATEILGYCDLMLMPSLYEGFGIAALEASAVGLPVIAGKVPGLLEAVEDGLSGLLFEPNDIEGMATAILEVFQNAEMSRGMGCYGMRRVQRTFSINVMVSRYMELYSNCLS